MSECASTCATATQNITSHGAWTAVWAYTFVMLGILVAALVLSTLTTAESRASWGETVRSFCDWLWTRVVGEPVNNPNGLHHRRWHEAGNSNTARMVIARVRAERGHVEA